MLLRIKCIAVLFVLCQPCRMIESRTAANFYAVNKKREFGKLFVVNSAGA